MIRFFCFWVAMLTAAASILAQDQVSAVPSQLEIPQVTKPPNLEDFLSGIPGDAGTQITDFRQREPGDGTPVSQKTTAVLSYDERNLYVVFICKDDPGKIRARMAKREAVFGDDAVGVILDTFRDRRRAYFFLVNPFGIQVDGITTEGQQDDLSFDTVWHSEGRLTADGYIVLIAIPFKSLRFAKTSDQTWGAGLIRIIARNNETAFWPYITRRVQGFAQQLATMHGIKDISPGRNLQFIPYGALAAARFLDSRVPEFATDAEVRAGLDAKMVLRDALALDVTLNPDFSQVESDEPQVTINRRFEVFFPEKRPFFIENAGFFRTPQNLFFSRRIVDPQLGLRLTGKVGRWAVAGLVTDDGAGALFPESHPLHEESAGIGVFRVQREFAQQSSVGVLMTSRDLGPTYNRVFAVDTHLRLTPNWSFAGQAIGSDSRQLDGSRPSGPAYLAEMSYSSRKLSYRGQYSDISPDFHSQLGFVPRVDIRQMDQIAAYRWFPEQSAVLSFGPFGGVSFNWDREGRLQDRQIFGDFAIEFPAQTRLTAGHTDHFELFQGEGFQKRTTEVTFRTEWFKWLTVFSSYRWGTDINFFPAPGLKPFLGDSRFAFLQLTIRPTSRFRVDHTYIHSRLHTPRSAPVLQVPRGAAIFNNHLFRWKFNYQFTRELSLRAIVDYNAVLPNRSIVRLEREKRLTGDILLTYLANPWTALYVGYTDRYENLMLDPLTSSLARTTSPTTSTGRQFFAKLSYLFRF